MNQLQKFQKKHCLDPDGKIGKKTLSKFKEVFHLNNEQTAHFVAQITHETGNFKYEEENLNYSYERLLKIFKHDFDWNKNRRIDEEEKALAAKLARNPEQIANFVYANQNGNGNEASGDGWKFRGRGAIQLTTKSNYERFANKIRDLQILENPDLVVKKYFFDSAIFFFNDNHLWQLCETVDNQNIIDLTKKINGGTHGLKERIELTYLYYKLLCN